MGSLKDALKNAGFRQSNQENERARKAKWNKSKKSVGHQEQRNYCEVCDSIQPDVEKYNHRNPTIKARWICSSCADKNLIDDKFRVTAQSDFSIKKTFRREYGATRKDLSSQEGQNKHRSETVNKTVASKGTRNQKRGRYSR